MKARTGGSAFPVTDSQAVHRIGAAAIDGITDSAERDRVYIGVTAIASAGMTLRDYFAAKAMAALICMPCDNNGDYHEDALAETAYKMADQMLAERAK